MSGRAVSPALNEGTTRRLGYIDSLKFIGLFLMIFGHVSQFAELDGFYNNINIWLHVFHMPLFFLAYGMAVSYSKVDSFRGVREKIGKRAKRILIPYLLWSAIYAPKIGIRYFVFTAYGTNQSLSRCGTNAVLWFLPVMFLAAAIDLMVDYCLRKKAVRGGDHTYIIWLLLIVIECAIGYAGHLLALKLPRQVGLPFGVDIAFVGCAFINAGKAMRRALDGIAQKRIFMQLLFPIFSVLLIIVTFVLAQYNQPSEYWIVEMAWGVYGRNFPLFFVEACLSVLAMVCISQWLSKCKVFPYLGRESLFVMAFHYIPLPYVVKLLSKALGGNISLLGYCFVPLVSTIIALAICVSAAKIIKRYIPMLC